MVGLISTKNRRDDFSTLSNRLFDDWFSEMNNYFGLDIPLGIFDNSVSKFSYPRVNIIDTEEDVIIEASVPGLTKDDVSVQWCDNQLTISGGKDEVKEDQKDIDYRRREITKKRFSRSFSVYNSQYDCYNITAEVKDGLLTIKLPKIKVEENKPEIKKIEIK